MKKRLIVLSVVLALLVALCAVPTVFADEDITNSISINEVITPTRTIDMSIDRNVKSIDLFVGESVTIKTDLIIKKTKVIENPDETLVIDYRIDDECIGLEKISRSGDRHDSGYAFIRREAVKLTGIKPCQGKQLIVVYLDGDTPLVDSIQVNVYDKNVESMTLGTNVTTLKTNQVVDLSLIVNGSSTLSVSDPIHYYINDIELATLKGYAISSDASDLNVKIVLGDGESAKTFTSTLKVERATEMTSVIGNRAEYSYLLKNKTGKIDIYVTAGSFPNITMSSKHATLINVASVESDKADLDKYTLTISLDGETRGENLLISADNEYYAAKLNIIGAVTSVAVAPDNTKFESGKASVFHVVVNGIKDVDTEVVWTVNGVEQSTKDNVLSYKAISENDIKVSAKVDEIIGEYNYTISTDKGSIILTVIMSLLVIIICVPILITLKKHAKPDLKAIIYKDNIATAKELNKLKDDLDSDDNKGVIKKILRINASITRSEKRAQQESFQCENKAFNGALTALSEAKQLMSDLLETHKSNPKDVNINLIDNIIFCLENSNKVIDKVNENM